MKIRIPLIVLITCVIGLVAPSLLAVTIDDFEARVYDPDSDAQTLNMPHRLFTPENYDPNADYPLVIYLHGLGAGNGDNLQQMENHGHGGMFFAEDEQQAYQPSFVVLPQEPGGTSEHWHQGTVKQLLMGLIDSLLTEFPNIDPDRVYIGGISMGGQGAWDQLVTQPNKYAAGVVVAGAGGTGGAGSIDHLPLWFLHSTQDGVVNVASSDNRVSALRDLGASTIYSRFGASGHVIGPKSCRIPELYKWLVQQRQGEAPQAAPLLRITEYSVGSDLDISGVVADEAAQVSEVNWENSAGGSGQATLFAQSSGSSASTFTNYFEGGSGYYGFQNWPFTSKAAWIVGFKEYHPVGFETSAKYPCIIDVHGTGFKSRDPSSLNEGLARFINQNNEVENPINGQKYIAICPAGGEWLSVEELCNLIEYAYNHPNVDQSRIFVGGLSGGGMSSLRLLGQAYASDNVTDITQYVQKVAGVYSLAGTMFSGYDPAIAATKPILIHHGENDSTRSPTNTANLRATVGSSVIFNCFQGLGHSGNVWDRVWVDGNATTPMVTINGIPSDPYKSVWEFFIENQNGTASASSGAGWSVEGIALSSGTNQINITATGWPYYDSDPGETTFNQSVDIDFTAPSGDTTPPILVVSSPTHSEFSISTESSSLAFSGSASDNASLSSVTWETDRGQSGTASGTSSWSATVPLSMGLNRLSITAEDTAGNIHTQIFYVVRTDTIVNQAPRVRGGPDILASLPDDTVDLDATFWDDGLPQAATLQWSKQSGPGTVTFGNASSVDTTATFSAVGIYVLRLTADDTVYSAYDEIIVEITEAPVAASGPAVVGINCHGAEYTASDGTVFLSDRDEGYLFGGGGWDNPTADIAGTIDDEIYRSGITPRGSAIWTNIQVPNGEYVVTLKLVSPNNAVGQRIGDYYIEEKRVLNDHDVREHVAMLTALDYDFLVTVTDGVLDVRLFEVNDQPVLCGILVRNSATGTPVNTAPVVDAGTDETVLLANGANLDGTVTDDGVAPGNPTPTTTWSKVSGPGTVAFGDANAVDTTATFSVEGVYVLQLFATDGDLSSTDTVTITVLDELPPQPARTVLYDFGTQSIPGNGHWNLVQMTLDDVVLNATDTDGNATPFDLLITDDFRSRDTTGSTGTGLYPDDATSDSFYADDVRNGEVTFEDLDPQELYTIKIFASAASGTGVGEYTIGATTLTLDAIGNSTQTIAFTDLAPDVSGSIVLNCAPQNGVGNAYINVIELIEQSTGSTNEAPVVDAGVDQTVAISAGATLDGTATDDGVAPGDPTPTVLWSKVSGPGTVGFGDANAADTTASFSVVGTYVLELFATDGVLNSQDTVTIVVETDPPQVSRQILFDFGGQVIPTTGNWNLVRLFQDDFVENAIDTDGNATTIDLRISDDFRSRATNGPTGTALYPDNATYDSFYTDVHRLAEITLEGLTPSTNYSLTIYASAAYDPNTDAVGEYTIGSTTLTLDAADNTTQTITFSDVQADANGEIIIGFHATDDLGNAYINVLDLVESPSNQPPVAVADSTSVDEGQSVTINVLANDSDPDSGPSALTVVSVGSASNGSTEISGNQVIYTPNPGFYGAIDSFSYTISDGASMDQATVTVTVNDTSLDDDLTSVGLTAATIGTGATGNSRILANGDWEVNGSATGLGGTADSLVFENEMVSGDFRALVNIRDLAGGTSPQAGLLVRESLNADARTVAIATDSSTAYQIGERTTTGGAFSWATLTSSYSYPDAWVLLERQGDDIHVAVSSDGVTFVEEDVITLSSLASDVYVGVYSTSGSTSTTARAVFADYELTLLGGVTTVNFDFGVSSLTTPGNWNNITDISSGSVTDAVDSDGWGTGINAAITTAFANQIDGGVASGAVFPETAQRDSMYLTNATPSAEVLFSGLDPAKTYSFTFFCSRDATDNRTAVYTIGAQSVTLNASGNTDTTVTISNVTSNGSGEVVVGISRDTGVTWSYLSVISVEYQ